MEKQINFKLFYTKIIIIISLCLIVIALLFIFKDNVINLFSKANTVTEESNNKNAIIFADDPQQVDTSSENFIDTVIGAEYLKFSTFTFNCSPNNSQISTSIKNESSDLHINLNILITFFDENNNILTNLTCPIKSIEPNEIKSTYGIVDVDLSDCTDYEVRLLTN